MDKNGALVLAGVIFLIVAAIHVVRLVTNFEIKIAGKPMPYWASIVGLIVAGVLGALMFLAAKQ
jgi:uncharacterized membrane protein